MKQQTPALVFSDAVFRLQPEFLRRFDIGAYRAEPLDEAETAPFTVPAERSVSLEALGTVLSEAQQRFTGPTAGAKKGQESSDAWLAPRVHASLRLTRREAGDPSLWHWLTAVRFREYVLWRWESSSDSGLSERVLGSAAKWRNALARLWWTAEMGRLGSDYGPVQKAFATQELHVTLIESSACRSRPAAQAFLRFADNRGKGRSAGEIQRYRKALNCASTAFALDAAALDSGPCPEALRAWIGGAPDVATLLQAQPGEELGFEGPQETPPCEESIRAVLSLMERLEREMPVSKISPVASS